jgi:bifunctional DNA-binding transcriptional regulator/antitoxin component of YhaV-PrlF toxin-antitoxin module
MTTMLSTKGQVVLPRQARLRLRLRPGVRFICKVQGESIVLTPEKPLTKPPQLINDPKSGLRITRSPAETKVTSEDVRAALLDFP